MEEIAKRVPETNAAICGGLLGAVDGKEAVPNQWVNYLLNCRPAAGQLQVHHPRPEVFWPVDALEWITLGLLLWWPPEGPQSRGRG